MTCNYKYQLEPMNREYLGRSIETDLQTNEKVIVDIFKAQSNGDFSAALE